MKSFISSFRQNKIGIILIIITALMTSLGQVFWKLGQGEKNQIIFLLIGFTFYGVGTVLMILAFKHGSFSVLHPLLACGYIFALVWSKVFLNESIKTVQILGIILITAAVGFIGGGDE